MKTTPFIQISEFNWPCGYPNPHRIKHSWLKYVILKTEADILSDWDADDWDELGQSYAQWLHEATIIANAFDEIFSPKQLVDILPSFGYLDPGTKQDLKDSVHRAYLAKCGWLTSTKQQVEQSVGVLIKCYRVLIEVWKIPKTPDARQQVKLAATKFLAAAKLLHDLLDTLPRGVVLP